MSRSGGVIVVNGWGVEGTISAAAGVDEWYYIIIIIMVCGEWREGSKSCSSVILFFGSHAPSYDDLMDNEGFNFFVSRLQSL